MAAQSSDQASFEELLGPAFPLAPDAVSLAVSRVTLDGEWKTDTNHQCAIIMQNLATRTGLQRDTLPIPHLANIQDGLDKVAKAWFFTSSRRRPRKDQRQWTGDVLVVVHRDPAVPQRPPMKGIKFDSSDQSIPGFNDVVVSYGTNKSLGIKARKYQLVLGPNNSTQAHQVSTLESVRMSSSNPLTAAAKVGRQKDVNGSSVAQSDVSSASIARPAFPGVSSPMAYPADFDDSRRADPFPCSSSLPPAPSAVASASSSSSSFSSSSSPASPWRNNAFDIPLPAPADDIPPFVFPPSSLPLIYEGMGDSELGEAISALLSLAPNEHSRRRKIQAILSACNRFDGAEVEDRGGDDLSSDLSAALKRGRHRALPSAEQPAASSVDALLDEALGALATTLGGTSAPTTKQRNRFNQCIERLAAHGVLASDSPHNVKNEQSHDQDEDSVVSELASSYGEAMSLRGADEIEAWCAEVESNRLKEVASNVAAEIDARFEQRWDRVQTTLAALAENVAKSSQPSSPDAHPSPQQVPVSAIVTATTTTVTVTTTPAKNSGELRIHAASHGPSDDAWNDVKCALQDRVKNGVFAAPRGAGAALGDPTSAARKTFIVLFSVLEKKPARSTPVVSFAESITLFSCEGSADATFGAAGKRVKVHAASWGFGRWNDVTATIQKACSNNILKIPGGMNRVFGNQKEMEKVSTVFYSFGASSDTPMLFTDVRMRTCDGNTDPEIRCVRPAPGSRESAAQEQFSRRLSAFKAPQLADSGSRLTAEHHSKSTKPKDALSKDIKKSNKRAEKDLKKMAKEIEKAFRIKEDGKKSKKKNK